MSFTTDWHLLTISIKKVKSVMLFNIHSFVPHCFYWGIMLKQCLTWSFDSVEWILMGVQAAHAFAFGRFQSLPIWIEENCTGESVSP